MNKIIKRSMTVIGGLGLVAALAWVVLRPEPLTVETARAVRGPLQVTIDEDGQTRARDRYTLAAPIAGRLSRITLREGDSVTPKTVIATIYPLPIDPREAAQTGAQIQSLEAQKLESEAYVARAEADHQQAVRELTRYRELYNTADISRQLLEQKETAERRAAKDLAAAQFKVQSTAAEITRARAGLISQESKRQDASRVVILRPPTASRVMRILEQSERVVAAGTPLVVLSNPNKIEIVIDVLSSDAVKISPGAPVLIEGWGGAKPLRAQVRLVEPYGFTKISALGIEEQRVNVIADFVDSPERLGDGYRVEARIVIWEDPDVLQVPGSALFRTREGWSLFVVEGNRAYQRAVETGQRNALDVQITSGLDSGTEVILHPSNTLQDGSWVSSR
jgi:HlyD family secretion protein